MEAKVWNKTSMQELLVANDKAAVKALLVIYSRQTQSEQASMATREHNAVGFTATDAEILTSFAEQFKRKGFLSFKQMGLLKKRITKYWKQLLEEAASKGAEVSYKLPKKVA